MRLGGRMQPINGVCCERHRGVESETVGRADDIVVDRLRDADEWDADLAELVGNRQRAVAADDHKGVERHLLKHFDDPLGVHAAPV